MKPHMTDVSNRILVIFKHPKSTEEDPRLVGVTFPWLVNNGIPQTEKGKPWIYQSVELVQ